MLTLADLPPELLPRMEPGNLGCLWPLCLNQEDISDAVPVEYRLSL